MAGNDQREIVVFVWIHGYSPGIMTICDWDLSRKSDYGHRFGLRGVQDVRVEGKFEMQTFRVAVKVAWRVLQRGHSSTFALGCVNDCGTSFVNPD